MDQLTAVRYLSRARRSRSSAAKAPGCRHADGERYLDFVGRHRRERARPRPSASRRGADASRPDKLWHTSNLFRDPRPGAACRRGLSAATFADRVFFTNSGAEAMECAIKTARRYHFVDGHPERFRIITFEGAFHGRTLATHRRRRPARNIWKASARRSRASTRCRSATWRRVKAAISAETAAILIEPIQGEGGIRPVPQQFLRDLRELCDEHGLLLVFDEVQTRHRPHRQALRL